MTDEAMRDLANKHDKHIDLMASSIENIANTISANNSKLDNVIGMLKCIVDLKEASKSCKGVEHGQ